MDKAKITGIVQLLVQREGNDLVDEGFIRVTPVTANKFEIDYLPENSGKHQYFQVHVMETHMTEKKYR